MAAAIVYPGKLSHTNFGTQTALLLDAIIQGDQLAHKRIYEQYREAMFRICLRISGCREDAEDMLQESFMDAFSKLKSYRGESTFGAWLRRIVMNRCINSVRKRKALREDLLSLSDCDLPSEEECFDTEQEEIDYSEVIEASGRLPENLRDVFRLYALEGYGHDEVADILGITSGTSRIRLLRARNRVKEIVTMKRNRKMCA
ncbi:MAG: RNA polymerase sigma factor [Bacteroidetes bacterium]|nr:RNA polymerase sigma factor [Bacteroidota bacterium]MBU1718917.1 RNA polymerase sigma factor [Bacteroidota bacterium]